MTTSVNDDRLQADASRALSQYGFDPVDVDQFERMPVGVKNLNFRVRACGEDWVLKCHPGARAAQSLARTQRFEQALAHDGLPVARLHRTPSGDTVVTQPSGSFTLHSWVEGRHIPIDRRDDTFSGSPQLASRLGELVGHLHRVGTDLAGTDRIDVARLLAGPRRSVSSIRRGPPHRFQKMARLRLRRSPSDLDRWILQRWPWLRREARQLGSADLAPRFDATDVVLAHNDLNWENLLLGPDLDIVAVLDFDNATPMPRALDLGAAAAVLIGPHEDRLTDFLEAYAETTGHVPNRDLVRIGMRWKCVRSMLWSIDSRVSGRVADERMVATWCRALESCVVSL